MIKVNKLIFFFASRYFLCFYRVIETLVKVWENLKKLWKHLPVACVPIAFHIPTYIPTQFPFPFPDSHLQRGGGFPLGKIDRGVPMKLAWLPYRPLSAGH